MAHLGTGKPAPAEWIEFMLIDRFKWTLAYVRTLSMVEQMRLIVMMGAEGKVAKSKHGRR